MGKAKTALIKWMRDIQEVTISLVLFISTLYALIKILIWLLGLEKIFKIK